MKNHSKPTRLAICALTLIVAPGVALAQTPAQIEYERQQREYWRQQEQQRQEQQRQQQIMQENARRQQEESSRLNNPAGPSQSTGVEGGMPGAGPATEGTDPASARLSAARAMWEKRPALAADHNPLLGKWKRSSSTRSNSSDPLAALEALAKGGLCEVLFGGGVFEFRHDRLMGMDERTGEQELDRVAYRGNSKHVVVLPETTLKLIEFDFDGSDRINWTGQDCVLVRVSSKTGNASETGPETQANTDARPAAANVGGVLSLSVGPASAGSKVAGRQLWVLKEDAQVALIKGGLTSTADASVLQSWIRACLSKAPACEQGARALKVYSVGLVTTDADGRAQTPPLPAGRYWVLSDTKIDNKRWMWNQPVDVKGAQTSLTLDQQNAIPVE